MQRLPPTGNEDDQKIADNILSRALEFWQPNAKTNTTSEIEAYQHEEEELQITVSLLDE